METTVEKPKAKKQEKKPEEKIVPVSAVKEPVEQPDGWMLMDIDCLQAGERVIYLFKKDQAFYPLEPEKVKAIGNGKTTAEVGLSIRAKGGRVVLFPKDNADDLKRFNFLENAVKLRGNKYHRVDASVSRKEIKTAGAVMELVSKMDVAKLRSYFTQEEMLDGGINLVEPNRYELQHLFLSLNKEI